MWFKTILRCQHLYAESEIGMRLQFYTALIASVLVVRYTKRKPNKRLGEALRFYFMGIATQRNYFGKSTAVLTAPILFQSQIPHVPPTKYTFHKLTSRIPDHQSLVFHAFHPEHYCVAPKLSMPLYL